MPIGRGRPCFLGSTSLGRCHLGNIPVWLRDSAVHPRGNACLPEGITCLGIAGLRGPKPCRAPDCLGKDHTPCLRRSAVHQGRLGTACLGDLTLRQSVIHWGSLGTACLGDLSLSASERVLSTREAWELPAWEISLFAGERVLSARKAWELPAWEISLSAWELPAWEISLAAGERVLSAGEAWELPAWEIMLSAWERVLSPREDWELPAWKDQVLPAWEIALSAWERVLSAREVPAWRALGLPAWEIALRGRALSTWEAWGEALGINLHAWELLAACEALVARVTCLLFAQGKALAVGKTWELLTSYTSFLFIYKIVKFFLPAFFYLVVSFLLDLLYKFLALLVVWGC